MVGSTQKPERVDIPDVQREVSRLDFPTDPGELADKVEERGAARVAEVLRRLPEGRYETPAEVLDSVRQLDPENRDVPGDGIRDTGEIRRPSG